MIDIKMLKKLLANTKGLTNASIWTMFVIGILVIGSGLVYYGNKLTATDVVPPQDDQTPEGETPPTGGQQDFDAGVSCDTDDKVDALSRYQDTLSQSGGITYIADVTSYADPAAGAPDIARRVTLANTTATGSYATSSNALICKEEAPINYQGVARTYKMGETSSNTYGYHSDVRPVLTAQGPEVTFNFIGKSQDRIRIAVENNLAGVNKELNVTPAGQDGGNTIGTLGFGAVPATIRQRDGSAVTLGVGESIDVKLRVKTNNTNRQFGEDDFGYTLEGIFKERTSDTEELLSVLVAEDAPTTDYASSGPVLSRAKGDFVLIDKSALLGDDDDVLTPTFEYIFATQPITTAEEIWSYLHSAKDSSTNPSADTQLRWCALGRYNSADQEDTVRIGCFDDSTNNNEVAFPTNNTATFDWT